MSAFDFASEIREETSIFLSKKTKEVFGFVAVDFFANYRKWSPEVDVLEGLSDGEFGVNYLFRQVQGDKNGLDEAILTVTHFEPNHHFAYANLKEHYSCHYIFEDIQGSSTRLTLVFQLENIDILMRPFNKLLRMSIQEGIRQTANNIKQLLDNGQVGHEVNHDI